MAYWLTSFGGLAIPQALGTQGSHDIGAGVAVAPIVQLPGARAYDPTGGATARRPSATISVNGMLTASDPATLQALFNTWQQAIGARSILYRTGGDGSVHAIWARLMSATSRRVIDNIGFLPITLTFETISLPWVGTARIFPLTDLGGSADDLTSMGAESSGSPWNLILSQYGNLLQKSVVFVLTASAAGPVSGITFTSGTTGHVLAYGGSILANTTLIIDTGARSVVNNNSSDYANLVPPTTFEEWFAIAPGTNVISLAVTSGALIGSSISYSDAWA